MLIKRFSLLLLLTIFVLVGFVDSVNAQTMDSSYRPWQWMQSRCVDCEIFIQITNPKIQTEKVKLFVEALVKHKADLQELYGVHGEEYNLLATMAVGILGRESLFFTSTRYQLKETFPSMVKLMKVVQLYLDGRDGDISANSRGPTQIKIVPEKIAEIYRFDSGSLYIPENAALATMGFLIEALGELKRRIKVNNLPHINPTNYVDYLPYIYFGGTRALVNKTATPDRNIYVQDMKRYMTWIQMYQRDQNLRPSLQ